MTIISTRIEKLEALHRPSDAKRFYLVAGACDDESARDFVRAQGFIVEPVDLVARLVGIERVGEELRQRYDFPISFCGGLPPDKWRAVA